MLRQVGNAWIRYVGLLISRQAALGTEINDKLDADPIKVTTKAGVSWSDTYDMDDRNLSFSGLVALDQIKNLTHVSTAIPANGAWADHGSFRWATLTLVKTNIPMVQLRPTISLEPLFR